MLQEELAEQQPLHQRSNQAAEHQAVCFGASGQAGDQQTQDGANSSTILDSEQQLLLATPMHQQQHLPSGQASSLRVLSQTNSSPAVSPCASALLQDAASSQPARAGVAQQQQLPAWKQQVQQEKQLLQVQRKQAAAQAAAAAKQQQLAALAASWEVAQQQLPFHMQHSQVCTRVQHKLPKTLSTILRTDAAPAAATDASCTAQQQALHTCTGMQELPCCSSSSTREAIGGTEPAPAQLCGSPKPSSRSGSGASGQLRASRQFLQGTGSSQGLAALHSTCRSARASKQQAWASADAVTDAEVDGYLLVHWQQQHREVAALELQCAWRSRVARLAFGRYLSKRHCSVHATVQPAFWQWHSWSKAAAHHRRYQQQAVLQAWRELLQLQLQFCRKVLRGLQRGVLSGDMPSLLMWRLCSSSGPQATAVRPSLAGMLASVLMHKVPQLLQQECFRAWRHFYQSQAALRSRALRMLTAVCRKLQQQQVLQAVRFWRMFTACSICERLQLQQPAYPYSCEAFDAWLWHHEQQRRLQQQAEGLSVRLGVLRYFACWHGHVHKLRVMRDAWSGLLLHTPEQLLWCGLSAFKANWREQQLHKRLLAEAVACWREVTRRNKAVAAVRMRIKQVAEARRKTAGLAAFQCFRHMSQLLSAAAVLKQWQARPLLLAHLHAWMHDTLHATFYLCWWRWRNKALARLRWRAALGMHMYRAHWLQLELFFAGWRKAAVSAKLENQRLQQQEQQEPGLTAVSADLSSGEAAASRSPGVTWQDKMDSEAPPGPDGLQCSNRPAPAAGQLSSTDAPVEQQHQHQQENQDLEGDSQACEGCQQDAKVNVSLADSLVGHTWRPLLQRKAVMAPQGLARLTGLRLGRAVRDLRELEGGFILKDSSSGASGLLSSRVFVRAPVSPGLKAMAVAQLPMHVLWRACFPADKYWWQRAVGLVEHKRPHPDSWRALLTPQQLGRHSCSCSSKGGSDSDSGNSQQLGVPAQQLQDFFDPQNSTAAYKCTCSRCPWHVPEQDTAAADVITKPVVDAAALMARARSRLRAGLRLQPLEVPEAAGSSPAATPAGTGVAAAEAFTSVAADQCSCSDKQTCDSRTCSAGGSCVLPTGAGGVCDSGALSSSRSIRGPGSARIKDTSSLWPAAWACEDIAGLSRLVQAEELLETAVHLLLGIGADSTSELYDKLRQMTRGLQLQGDLLTWLLSAVFAHDHAISHAALSRMRTRDGLRLATLELQERAMALHLHIPYKFTLSRNRACVDVRASWAAIIAQVEKERDWDASSADEDDDPQERLWAALLAEQQQQQQLAGQAPVTAPWAQGVVPMLPHVLQQLPQLPQQNARQPALAIVLAAASGTNAGRVLSTAAKQLTPGNMLAQTAAAAAGEVWKMPPSSQPQTPRAEARTEQQAQLQQQLDADQRAAQEQQQREQQKARPMQDWQRTQAMAAAQGLFGRSRGTAVAAARDTEHGLASHHAGQQLQAVWQGMAAPSAAQEEFFGGPGYLPVASLSGAVARASATGARSSTSAAGATAPMAPGAASPVSNSVLQPQQQQRPTSARRDTPAAAAVRVGDAVGASGNSTHSPGPGAVNGEHAMATPAAADTQAAAVECSGAEQQQQLQAELQGVLAELLAPVLGLASPAAAAGAATGAVGDGDGCTSHEVSSSLQQAQAAATHLASACAEWALDATQHKQQHQVLLAASEALMAPGPTCKPRSAPSHQYSTSRGLQGGLSTCSSSSSVGRPGSSGGQAMECSSARRAASDLRSNRRAAPGQVTWGPISVDATCAAAASAASTAATEAGHLSEPQQEPDGLAGLGSGSDQHASWADLAVAQGLLDPAAAARGGLSLQQQHEQQHGQLQGAEADPFGSDAGSTCASLAGQQSQASRQESSSCSSSLPSIPSARDFWASLEQLQAGTKKAGSQAAHVAAGQRGQPPRVAASEGGLLPPIGPANQPQLQQAGGNRPCHVQVQEQQPQALVEQAVADADAQPGPPMGPDTQQLLPQVLAALEALHSQCQPGSTQQRQSQGQQQQQSLLVGLQRALSQLEPAQLQQQVQLLLELQQQHRMQTLHEQEQQGRWQQQESGAVPIMPWGGELQPPAAVATSHGAAAWDGSSAAGVLSTLLGASLSTRLAFWRQHVAPEHSHELHGQHRNRGTAFVAGSSSLSHQLHQLAWSSLLLTAAPPRGFGQQGVQHVQAGEWCHSPKEPMGALRQKLHTYLSAQMQLRRQQQCAPPLAPAEKWITLQHEEQVLEFITSMSIAVHQQLLRKHQGLPAASKQQQAVAFGSSTSKGPHSTAARAAATAASAAAAQAAALQAQALAAITAAGSRVDLAQSRRLMPTIPRSPPVRPVPVYVVPRPHQLHLSVQQERLEPLQAWVQVPVATDGTGGGDGDGRHSSVAGPEVESAAVDGGRSKLQSCGDSFKSSASSWQSYPS